MEKMQWFKFSISEWKMGKIQKCNPLTKSAFLELCCLYWINETKLTIEDAIIECDEEHYNILLSKKIIKEDGIYIKILFLDEQFENVLEKSTKAKESVEKRWAKRNNINIQTQYDSNTNVLQTNYDSNTEEKRIEEEEKRKEQEDNQQIPSYDVFLAYALANKPFVNKQEVKLKYESWKVNDWNVIKDGKNKKILNWKTTLLNTLPYLSEFKPQQNTISV